MAAASIAEHPFALQATLQAKIDKWQREYWKTAGQCGKQTAEMTQNAPHLHRFTVGTLLAERTAYLICAWSNGKITYMWLSIILKLRCPSSAGLIASLHGLFHTGIILITLPHRVAEDVIQNCIGGLFETLIRCTGCIGCIGWIWCTQTYFNQFDLGLHIARSEFQKYFVFCFLMFILLSNKTIHFFIMLYSLSRFAQEFLTNPVISCQLRLSLLFEWAEPTGCVEIRCVQQKTLRDFYLCTAWERRVSNNESFVLIILLRECFVWSLVRQYRRHLYKIKETCLKYINKKFV